MAQCSSVRKVAIYGAAIGIDVSGGTDYTHLQPSKTLPKGGGSTLEDVHISDSELCLRIDASHITVRGMLCASNGLLGIQIVGAWNLVLASVIVQGPLDPKRPDLLEHAVQLGTGGPPPLHGASRVFNVGIVDSTFTLGPRDHLSATRENNTIECDPKCAPSDPCCDHDKCSSEYPVSTNIKGACCFLWAGHCHTCCKAAAVPGPGAGVVTGGYNVRAHTAALTLALHAPA